MPSIAAIAVQALMKERRLIPFFWYMSQIELYFSTVPLLNKLNTRPTHFS